MRNRSGQLSRSRGTAAASPLDTAEEPLGERVLHGMAPVYYAYRALHASGCQAGGREVERHVYSKTLNCQKADQLAAYKVVHFSGCVILVKSGDEF